MIPAIALVLALSLPSGSTWGPTYEVHKDGELWRTEQSLWFHTRDDWTRFMFLTLRDRPGITKEGALLALAHARIAGGHWLSPKKCRGPMKGFNMWGIRATKQWKGDGKPYFYHGGLDWRYFSSPDHGAMAWLFVMRNYPQAKDQLYEDAPDVPRYVLGLCFGKGGRKYMACKKTAQGTLQGPYKASWVSRLTTTMDMARKSLRKQGFAL